MSGNRITRKEIKRDELVETIGGLTTAFESHARSFIIAAAALVLLAAAVSLGVWYSRTQAASALTSLGAVQRAASGLLSDQEGTGAASSAHRQKAEEVVKLADGVISKYPSAAAAPWASYYKALGQKELADFTGAAQTLKPLLASGTDDFLSGSARVLDAQLKEAQGDLTAAAEAFGTLAASAPSVFPVDLALANQARILDQQGKKQEADDIYRRITQEFPDSPFAREAGERLNPTPAPRG